MATADGPALSYTPGPGWWVVAITVLGSWIAALMPPSSTPADRARAALVPLTAIMLALSARSGQLANRIGPRLQLSLPFNLRVRAVP